MNDGFANAIDEELFEQRISLGAIRNANTATKKLISLLLLHPEEPEYCPLLWNEIDKVTKDSVAKLERAFDLYEKKCRPIIYGRLPIPTLIREKSNQVLADADLDLVGAVEQMGRTTPTTVTTYVKEIEWATIHLVEERHMENYRGLDSDRDTEEELENIVRMYPEAIDWGRRMNLPNFFNYDNLLSVSFIPKILQLRRELYGDVDESFKYARGRVLENFSSSHSYFNVEGKKRFDILVLEAFKRLKELGLFLKADIQQLNLLNILFWSVHRKHVPEAIFRLFVEMDPDALAQTLPLTFGEDEYLPLHYATLKIYSPTIPSFLLVFEMGIRYFSKKKGIEFLFRKGPYNTPFQELCRAFGQEYVSAAIENTLGSFSHLPYDTGQSLLSAAVDDRIHLDCVYFVLRREPDLLAKLTADGSQSLQQ